MNQRLHNKTKGEILMYNVKVSDKKTVEVNGTLTLDFTLKVENKKDLEDKLALLSGLGIVDASVMLMHVDGTVNSPRITNAECEVAYIEDYWE